MARYIFFYRSTRHEIKYKTDSIILCPYLLFLVIELEHFYRMIYLSERRTVLYSPLRLDQDLLSLVHLS